MPLSGYHHLPQVSVMGRNVRTAQSKSSVKMSLKNSESENNDTMFHLDGGSKIVKLLTSGHSEVIENPSNDDNKPVAELGMTNGIDEASSSAENQMEVADGGDKSLDQDSSAVPKKKRGRKKKNINGKDLAVDVSSSELSASHDVTGNSELNTSMNTTDNCVDSELVLDDSNQLKSDNEILLPEVEKLEKSNDNSPMVSPSPVVKKKRGRKKKIRNIEDPSLNSPLSEMNAMNQSTDTSDLNASLNDTGCSLDESNKSDLEVRSPGKRKRASRSLVNKRASRRSSSIRSSDRLGDAVVSHPVQNMDGSNSKHMPRCILMKPTEVPSESYLEKLKSMDSTTYDLQHPRLWEEGEMLWARVSGHPYWPCMISKCPFTNMLSKIKGDVKIIRSYHVQFFGDECERGWVNEPSLMAFKGKEDFLELARQEVLKSKAARKVKSNYNPFKVNSARSLQWNFAVEEAEAAFTLTLKDRLVQYKFDYVFINEEEAKSISKSSITLTPVVSGKRKWKDSLGRTSQERSRAKKRRLDRHVIEGDSSFLSYYARHCDIVRQQHPDWNASFMSEYLRQQWAEASSDACKQSQSSPNSSKSLASPILPDGEKRLKKPSKKIVESLLQGKSVAEGKGKPKTCPQPKKRGRPRKILVAQPLAPNPHATSEADEVTAVDRREVKPKAVEAASSARKMSQDSDSSLESKKRPKETEPYELEIFKLLMTSRIEKENICSVCEKNGELLECAGTCGQFFHLSCCGPEHQAGTEFKCEECIAGIHSCFSCKKNDSSTKKCSVSQCGKYYHDECIRNLKFARVISESKGFVCPLHICATCAVDNIRNPKATKGRLYRCTRCPVAYHFGDFCLAAGSKNLASVHIVCSDHFQRNKSFSQHTHVNITWCFSCSKGGTLLCCDNCPASYHAECVKMDKTPDEAWYCEDCVAGKKLLYGSIVWVKVGNYRWWPGEICHPRHVPLNIQEKAHQIGEFPVRFFGSHDYYWIHRGRVFLFEEGDKASRDSSSKGLFKVYMRGVKEATEAFKLWKAAKAKKEVQEQERNDKKPSQFKFVKNNVPIGNVQIYKAELSEIPHCECTYDQEEPCSSDCLNRMMMYECHPAVCHAKEKCNNQRFQKRQHAQCEPFRAEGRGWGLRAMNDIKKGQFVMEYVGDLIDEEECKKRIKQYHEDNITNFYMLTVDKNRIIDAGPKGNYSRFMNHSCCPNMETQKWMVNGDIRVGLFALCDISQGTELVFNYNLECLGNEKTACACGSDNCSGFLGVRPKTAAAIANEKKVKELKKKRKKKKSDLKKEYEDDCFRCGEGGELVMCDRIKCPKVYHLQCLNLTKPPTGKWACPWHHCDECGKAATVLCSECPNSYCAAHVTGNIKEVAGCQICSDHDEFLEILSKSLHEDILSNSRNETDSLCHPTDTEMAVDDMVSSHSDSPVISNDSSSALVNGVHDMTNSEVSSQDSANTALPEIDAAAHQKKLSTQKQTNHSRNSARQPGLTCRISGAGSSNVCRAKARYKAQLSSLTPTLPKDIPSSVCKMSSKASAICAMLQAGANVQDSDDNDSISDLVIDIP